MLNHQSLPSQSPGAPSLNEPAFQHIRPTHESSYKASTLPPITREQAVTRLPSLFAQAYLDAKKIPAPAALNKAHFTSLDDNTAKLIQIETLAETIGGTLTARGAQSLLRTLLMPACEESVIAARQDAIRELENNKILRDQINQFLTNFDSNFSPVDFFIDDHHFRRTKSELKMATKALDRLQHAAEQISPPQSPLLLLLINEIKELRNTRSWQLCHGDAVAIRRKITTTYEASLIERLMGLHKSTIDSVVPRNEAPWINRMLDGIGWPILPRSTAALVVLTNAMYAAIDVVFKVDLIQVGLLITPLVILWANLGKKRSDEYCFLDPLANALKLDKGIHAVMDAISSLDELYALSTLKDRFENGGCFPTIVNSPTHYLRAEKLHNPTLALLGGLSVANNIELGKTPWAITGPNSGGKSTLGITVEQTQLLAHAGARVPAESVELAIADCISYQAQLFNALEDPEGRFGTEIIASSEILDTVTSKSLRVFDELGQGTTTGESEIQAGNIVRAHDAIGGSSIWITHAFNLVAELAIEGSVLPKKIEYSKGVPTHRVIDGISKYSGAARVARKYRMDAESLEARLAQRGIKLRLPLKRELPMPGE